MFSKKRIFNILFLIFLITNCSSPILYKTNYNSNDILKRHHIFTDSILINGNTFWNNHLLVKDVNWQASSQKKLLSLTISNISHKFLEFEYLIRWYENNLEVRKSQIKWENIKLAPGEDVTIKETTPANFVKNFSLEIRERK